MPTLLAQQCEAILEAAARSAVGIRVYVANATALAAKQALYRFRRELRPAYSNIQIILSPDDPDHRLWLVRRDTVQDLDPQEEAQAQSTAAIIELEI